MTDLRTALSRRPWLMQLLLGFCLFMALVYMPFDLFLKPVAEDQEVWFGFMLTGWAAKATEPLHWAIYAAGAVGFWKMRSWMWPWAAVYALQVAIGMVLGEVVEEGVQLVHPVDHTSWIISAAAQNPCTTRR